MTVETEVANLTTAVDNLAEAVNVKKATLDASVADAESARDAAAASATTASGHATSAAASASAAALTASSLAGFNLDAISQVKADTAVDVFVYDTSKDSDGGAWRKRTQHTSWYNETLNTATRGSRKEFPAVAVIVLQNGLLTIYDGDDPDLPMWMVFEATVYTEMLRHIQSSASCFMLNGMLASATGTNEGVILVDFISDVAQLRISGGSSGWYKGNISERNANKDFDYGSISSTYAIVNDTVNDVAMTVLPNAPIDAATGLPVPTIAVATDGGVSVIKDDGTVVDITGFVEKPTDVHFKDNGELVSTGEYDQMLKVFDIPSSDTTVASYKRRYSYHQVPKIDSPNDIVYATYGIQSDNDTLYRATSKALVTISENVKAKTSGMVAFTSSDYNTGWMNGDIKGAFLADTDDTDLVGSGELVTNGTFDTDTSGWSASSATLSVVSNTLRIANNTTAYGYAYQAITTVAGNVYTLTLSYTKGTSSGLAIYVGTSAANDSLSSAVATSSGTYSYTFTATGTSTYVSFVNSNNTDTYYSDVDNISVRLAEEDRSVNGNGLQVFGTVTKSAVATGAELVAYSGFSASNYLEQPYNSDLDFGTGDFCVMGWVKETANSATEVIFSRAYHTGSTWSGSYVQAYFNADGTITSRITDDGGSTKDTITSSSAYDTNTFNLLAIVRRGSNVEMWINGKKVASDVAITQAAGSLSNTSATFTLGAFQDQTSPLTNGSLALFRISATAPKAEQIKKIYEDEKVLFQENAAATLYGASDAVTALAHDSDTGLLHVGTSAGRSVFQGLRRVSNTTTAVGTAISASNGLVAED